MMKKLILISALLFSFNVFAEMYSCSITGISKITKELKVTSKGVRNLKNKIKELKS